ncbi:MAG: hypothetical protein WC728_16865 [Elusimicrobiota bacterium]
MLSQRQDEVTLEKALEVWGYCLLLMIPAGILALIISPILVRRNLIPPYDSMSPQAYALSLAIWILFFLISSAITLRIALGAKYGSVSMRLVGGDDAARLKIGMTSRTAAAVWWAWMWRGISITAIITASWTFITDADPLAAMFFVPLLLGIPISYATLVMALRRKYDGFAIKFGQDEG